MCECVRAHAHVLVHVGMHEIKIWAQKRSLWDRVCFVEKMNYQYVLRVPRRLLKESPPTHTLNSHALPNHHHCLELQVVAFHVPSSLGW